VLGGIRNLLHQGFFVPGINANPGNSRLCFSWGWIAEGYKPDLSTDAVAMYIHNAQMADGHWAFGPEARAPLCADTLGQTVLSMRGCNCTPRAWTRRRSAKSIQLAVSGSPTSGRETNYDLAWRLQGLVWGRKSNDAILGARRDLLAVQRSDGGWPDIASMESGAYTTGLAMMALASSGLPVSDPAYHGAFSTC